MKVLVFFSGGKDSQAALIWAVNKYGIKNLEAVFCDTGWEHPSTYGHITTICEQMGVKLVTVKSKKYNGFVDMAVKRKRFPSLKARFCTEELKSIPIIDYVLGHNENLICVEGIRRNESLSRSKMTEECMFFKNYFEPIRTLKDGKPIFLTYRKKDVMEWCNRFDASKFRPVFNWTAEQVINYIKEAGQTPNPLYYQGFKRVGCFPCVLGSQQNNRLIMENHPEQWQRLKEAEKLVGSSFFPPDEIPKRFTTNGINPTIEDVEKYLSDKNATMDMFADDGQPGCMSVYGLCE